MASLKEIRRRITSTKSTRQITSAMKMVAAAKLKRAQDAIIQIRPYALRLHDMISQVSATVDDQEISPLTVNREPNKVLLVVISANRGLCGGFNANVVKRVIEEATLRYPQQRAKGTLHLLFMGRKGAEMLKTKGFGKWPQRNELVEKASLTGSNELAEQLMEWFIKGEYDRIDIIYNQFKNAANQAVTTEQFLPVKPVDPGKAQQKQPDFIFEPELESLVRQLIPEALKIQLYKSLLDSLASQFGAQMTAMHQATDNATEMIRDLTLEYNRVRQATITSELIEIVSGAEALKS
jgi:F-type H+-transporting ATPase subunit gamma